MSSFHSYPLYSTGTRWHFKSIQLIIKTSLDIKKLLSPKQSQLFISILDIGPSLDFRGDYLSDDNPT